jgi:hypothetical protein
VPASSLCQPNGAVKPASWRRFETKRQLFTFPASGGAAVSFARPM